MVCLWGDTAPAYTHTHTPIIDLGPVVELWFYICSGMESNGQNLWLHMPRCVPNTSAAFCHCNEIFLKLLWINFICFLNGTCSRAHMPHVYTFNVLLHCFPPIQPLDSKLEGTLFGSSDFKVIGLIAATAAPWFLYCLLQQPATMQNMWCRYQLQSLWQADSGPSRYVTRFGATHALFCFQAVHVIGGTKVVEQLCCV
jgi:hypothetical protein